MRHPTMKTLLTLFLATLAPSAFAWSCAAEKDIAMRLDPAGLKKVKIYALAGELEVRENDEFLVDGRVCTSSDRWLDGIRVDTERDGDTMDITVIIPRDDKGRSPDHASVDLTVLMPTDIAVEIRDSSGNIYVSDINVALVDDSSGDITLEDTTGNANFRDSSGDIRLRGHLGNIEIVDSSGDLELEEIKGEVLIPRDSSGDIDIDGAHTVRIESDGSGEIDIRDVERDVDVGSDGSGSISIRSVGGSVHIGRDGSGSVRVTQVAGGFVMDAKGSGDVRTRDVKGEMSLPR